MPLRHTERHRTESIGWLRAAVLGANDGIISTASLMIGVAASRVPSEVILAAGIAGLVAGAMSMAAGEYVSVWSQADTEEADISRETRELEVQPDFELDELVDIYRTRGLDDELARQVAEQLMARDPVTAHVRDELGITETLRARPGQAAVASAASFAAGAALPVVTAILARAMTVAWITGISLAALFALGGLAAYAGGAPVIKGAVRVFVGGVLAMAVTAAIGHLFGVSA